MVLILLAIVVSLFAFSLSGEAQAGAFFGSGGLVLMATLLGLHHQLARQAVSNPSVSAISLGQLAWRSVARHPRRSSLTMGLVAAAAFLIVAIAAFRVAPSRSGTGGFALMAESDRPLFVDFSRQQQRQEFFGPQASQLAGADILGLRVRAGDDASCRNLFQVTQPRLLGVSDQMIAYFDSHPDQFAWSGYQLPAAVPDSPVINPWNCLLSKTKPSSDQPRADDTAANFDPPIPVVLDKSTAMYSLHLPPKIGHEFELNYDRPIRFRIAGLLSNTVLQGSLLLHESDLVRLFPETAGYSMLLIRCPDDASTAVLNLLEERFSDEGLDVRQTAVVLRDLLAVQNTYLSTFQSLGRFGTVVGDDWLSRGAIQKCADAAR